MKKIIVSVIILAILLLGCSAEESKFKHTQTQVTSEETNSSVKEKNKNNNIISYVNANYYKSDVRGILFYNKGSKKEIIPTSKEGKKVLKLVKLRYINTTEQPTKKNVLSSKINIIKNSGRAVEIMFKEKQFSIIQGGGLNEFKRVETNYNSLFYPLDCPEKRYFTFLPKNEVTLQKLGDDKELLDYLIGLDH